MLALAWGPDESVQQLYPGECQHCLLLSQACFGQDLGRAPHTTEAPARLISREILEEARPSVLFLLLQTLAPLVP